MWRICAFNYQQELEEYFVIGEECVVYENLQDMFIKAKYYLEHEEERKKNCYGRTGTG